MTPAFKHLKKNYLLLVVVFMAFILRTFSLSWDQGYHLHPDERMLIIVATRIDFFSNLNPDFFNYGSLPVYVLRGISEILELIMQKPIATYNGMLSVGRTLSAVIDTVTVILIYKIGLLLLKKRSFALFSSAFYALAFFPVQNAHFFIVDPLLTFFTTAGVYQLLMYAQEQTAYRIIKIAFFTAAAITTKFTGILLLPVIGIGVIVIQLAAHTTIKRSLRMIVLHGMVIMSVLAIASFLFMPYGYINHDQFIQEISQQLKMNSDPFIFPYTLQYVGTTPYWYYLKNIGVWGLGPIISLMSITGFAFGIRAAYKKLMSRSGVGSMKRYIPILLCLFFTLYFFAIIGKSAVKFMRYMLPLYPYFTLLAGYGLFNLMSNSRSARNSIAIFFITLSALWTMLFMTIYTQPTTRITASEWIYSNIPAGATLAVEHWDDRLPLNLPGNQSIIYQFEELALYNPDTPEKWMEINQQLERSDYLIIASNRLYEPLQRLTNCNELPEHRCYPTTSQYYKELFDESRGFVNVAEFTAYPGFELGSWKWEINDSSADESFTVYDHPRILIFKNNNLSGPLL